MKDHFKKIQKNIELNISETQNYSGSSFTIIGVSLLIGSIIGYIGYHININLFVGLLLIGSLLLIDGNNWLIAKRTQILSEIYSINTTLEETLDKIDEINSILDKVEYIKLLMKRLEKNLRFSAFLYSKATSSEQEGIINEEFILLFKYLSNLRSDLSIRLNEQKNLLEGAKGEVEKNINGTNDLNQVSELQKVRLDKQIKQFEELQRVLVKT